VRDFVLGALADGLFSTPALIATAGRGRLPKTALAHIGETVTTQFRNHGGAEPSWNTT
jgi:hypothetical protein